MLKLCLGVHDIPYAIEAKVARPVVRKAKRGGSAWRRADLIGGQPYSTTGDVAEHLERHYHIQEIFFEEHSPEIGDLIAESYMGALESLMSGAPAAGLQPLGRAASAITAMMKTFISTSEMERLGYPGVPTKAALAGVNHRLKHPYAKANARRPSFRDTGLMEANLVAWFEGG